MSNQSDCKSNFIVTPGNQLQCFMLEGDKMKLKLEQSKKKAIRKSVERIKEEKSLMNMVTELKALSPILVTGSSGYLGRAIVETLRAHEIPTIGIDLVNATTTDFIGCVSDKEFLSKTMQSGCKSIVHTAALHAPHRDFYSEKEYERINIFGTQNILTAAHELNINFLVYSSTTSLMITNEVKRREKIGDHPVILNESTDYGTPRNVYGHTKKIAEKICLDNKNVNVAILRCSRFFIEDGFNTAIGQSGRGVQSLSNGNFKANEILCGTRASLEDTVIAHLVALKKLGTDEKNSADCKSVIGPLIISAISPLLSNSFDVSLIKDSSLYKKCLWTPPSSTSRIYDSINSWKQLHICPKWNLHRLLTDYEQKINVEIIQNGYY